MGIRMGKGRGHAWWGLATTLLMVVTGVLWRLTSWEGLYPSVVDFGGLMKGKEALWMEDRGRRIGEHRMEGVGGDEFVSSGQLVHEEFAHLSNQIPDCSKSRKRPGSFLIVMTSHAGSTAIFSGLTQHPSVFWDRGKNRMVMTYEPLRDEYLRKNLTAGLEWVRGYFREVQSRGMIPAFKISIFPILREIDEWMKIMEEFDTQIIYNYRRDHLRRAVGRYAYEFLGDDTSIGGINTHTRDGLDVMQNRCSLGVGCSYEIEAMEDLHCIMTRSSRSHQYKSIGVELLSKGCALEVAYEDYLKYPGDVMNQIQDYLKLPRVELGSMREKGTSNNLCDVVKNFGDLCAAFAECPNWSWTLESGEDGCSCKDYDYVSRGGPDVNPLCSSFPQAGEDFWCFGFCVLCPQTPDLSYIFPQWPETNPFNNFAMS